MPASSSSRILLRATDASVLADVESALVGAGHLIVRGDQAHPFHLVITDHIAGDWVRASESPRAGTYVPLLSIPAESSPSAREGAFSAGADAVLARPFSEAELLGQVQSLLQWKARYDCMAEAAAELQVANQRLLVSHQRVNQEVELARRIQLSFLPQTLPELPRANFAVHYRPCGRVGGDFYDVFRLDEHHVGFYVADAMGHGIPASLLTMFLKRGVRGKDIYQNQYRLVPPDEVLQRLNHDLLEQGMMENSFITMVYGVFNNEDGTLHFSRAGHPHPVLVPLDGPAQLLEVSGSLLGVFETKFSEQKCRLNLGDKTLFYTDGTDSVSYGGQPAGTPSFLACVNQHRALPVAELVDRLSHELFHQAEQPDDFTLLGLEIVA